MCCQRPIPETGSRLSRRKSGLPQNLTVVKIVQYGIHRRRRTSIPTSIDYVPEPPVITAPPTVFSYRLWTAIGLIYAVMAFGYALSTGETLGFLAMLAHFAAAVGLGYAIGIPAVAWVLAVQFVTYLAISSAAPLVNGAVTEGVIAVVLGAVIYRLQVLNRDLATVKARAAELESIIRRLRDSFDKKLKILEETETELRANKELLDEALAENSKLSAGTGESSSAEELREEILQLQIDKEELQRQLQEQEKSHQRLRASDQLYRELFENASDIVYTHDLEGRILTFNKAALRLTGYSAEDLPELAIRDLIEPTHLPKAIGMIRRKVDDGRPTRYELDILTRDKRRVPVEVSTRLIFDQGKPVAVQGIARDISERRRAERIQQNNLRYLECMNQVREAMEHASDANEMIERVIDHVRRVFDADRAWLVHPCDPEAETVTVPYETTKPEYPGVFSERLDIQVTPIVAESFAAALGSDEPIAATGPWDPKDLVPGVLHPDLPIHSAMVMALRPKVGKPWMLGLHQCSGPREWNTDEKRLFRDIASRLSDGLTNLLLRRDLIESEKKYRSLFENSRDGICRTSPSGQLVDVNPAVVSMLEYDTKEELLAVDSETLCVNPDEWRSAIGGGFLTIEMRKKNGEELWVEGNFRAVTDEHGALSGFEGILRDITERRQLEAQVRHTQKLESLGVLAGGIAHDFNNLLMGILGNAGLALMEVPDDSPARDSVEKIETAALRAADLTNQMLAYSGKGKFIVQPVSLSQLVEEMTHLLDTVISKKTKIRYNFLEDLPLVEGDATQLRQVIMNLITNASDAIGDASGTITVKTGVFRIDEEYLTETYLDDDLPIGDYVYLEVTDSGCGMDQATISKIFDPFFTTKFTGRGLGLAAVLGIVRSHHGAIKVYSEPGIGSTFKVLLPAVGGTQALPIEPVRTIEDYYGSGTVLVVDDEETIRAVTSKTLQRFGYTVLTAVDGQSAVETFREHADEICLVLLDMTMPRMSGDEAFRAIRAIRGEVPVILSSGFTEQEATDRFSGVGLAGFIQKPYKPTDLLDKVHLILQGAGRGDQTEDEESALTEETLDPLADADVVLDAE